MTLTNLLTEPFLPFSSPAHLLSPLNNYNDNDNDNDEIEEFSSMDRISIQPARLSLVSKPTSSTGLREGLFVQGSSCSQIRVASGSEKDEDKVIKPVKNTKRPAATKVKKVEDSTKPRRSRRK